MNTARICNLGPTWLNPTQIRDPYLNGPNVTLKVAFTPNLYYLNIYTNSANYNITMWVHDYPSSIKSSYNCGRLCFYLTGVCRGNSLSPLNSVWHSHPIVFLFFHPFHYSYHCFFISSLWHLSSLWQAFKYRITCCLTQNQIYLSCPINGAVSLFILYIHSPKLLDHVLCFYLDK